MGGENTTVAICDDNVRFAELLRARIVRYCAAMDLDCSCSLYSDPIALLQADLAAVQVLFLDVDMPEMGGIEAARRLRENLPELIIVYVTNWIQYAPYGYQVAAFRYLLKDNLDNEFAPCMDALVEKLRLDTSSISLTGTEGSVQIATAHILYFEGAGGRRVTLHPVGGKKRIDCGGQSV